MGDGNRPVTTDPTVPVTLWSPPSISPYAVTDTEGHRNPNGYTSTPSRPKLTELEPTKGIDFEGGFAVMVHRGEQFVVNRFGTSFFGATLPRDDDTKGFTLFRYPTTVINSVVGISYMESLLTLYLPSFSMTGPFGAFRYADVNTTRNRDEIRNESALSILSFAPMILTDSIGNTYGPGDQIRSFGDGSESFLERFVDRPSSTLWEIVYSGGDQRSSGRQFTVLKRTINSQGVIAPEPITYTLLQGEHVGPFYLNEENRVVYVPEGVDPKTNLPVSNGEVAKLNNFYHWGPGGSRSQVVLDHRLFAGGKPIGYGDEIEFKTERVRLTDFTGYEYKLSLARDFRGFYKWYDVSHFVGKTMERNPPIRLDGGWNLPHVDKAGIKTAHVVEGIPYLSFIVEGGKLLYKPTEIFGVLVDVIEAGLSVQYAVADIFGHFIHAKVKEQGSLLEWLVLPNKARLGDYKVDGPQFVYDPIKKWLGRRLWDGARSLISRRSNPELEGMSSTRLLGGGVNATNPVMPEAILGTTRGLIGDVTGRGIDPAVVDSVLERARTVERVVERIAEVRGRL